MIYLIFFIMILIVFSVSVVIGLKIEDSKANKYNYSDETEYRDYYYVNEYPFHSKYLLTQNEYNFYSRLKNITEPLNLQILAKIRLADLIEIDNNIQGREWWALFGKIKSKHIDFAIADDMRIVMLIELDDYSHQRRDRQERDIFVNNSLSNAGYCFIRTYGNTNIIEETLYNFGYIQPVRNY